VRRPHADNRRDDLGEIADLGLTLAEGKLLLAGLQCCEYPRSEITDFSMAAFCIIGVSATLRRHGGDSVAEMGTPAGRRIYE
jgi:hypothetical protein